MAVESAQPVEIDVGRKVAGKYELVRLLGKGAMGEVWLATHDSLGGEFAIKLVKPSDEPEDETAAGRFQLEAQVSAKLSRKTRHIVSVSDHGEEEGLAYLVMELLDGESLDARIKRDAPLDLALTVAIVTQVARALAQAHAEGIFHRDLKPANIFLTKDEDGRLLVKLLDFGIARTQKPFRTRSPFMTGKDMVLGTPSYMSPEQARGLDSLDYRCDLWALAVVAYESLTRRIPWEGETVEDIFLSICTHRMVPIGTVRGDLPPAIDAIFEKSFAPKLDARFASAAELADAFEQLVDPLELEAAQGIRIAPLSSRRLPVSPHARISSPSLTGVEGHAAPRRQAEMPSDPVGFAVGGATSRTRKRRSSGWLLAGLVGLLTVGALGFTLLRTRAGATTPPLAPTALETTTTITNPPPNDRASIPPPPDTAAPASTPMVKATPAKPTRNPAATPVAKTAAAPSPTTPPPSPSPLATPATPPATAAPATAAPAKKPLDKNDVF